MYRPLSTEANSLSWNIEELIYQGDQGYIDFTVPIQRGYVWDNMRDSLLIHSICIGIPISEFYFNKVEKIYEGLEGKQRNRALNDFIKGLYSLHPKTPPCYTQEGNEVIMARRKFSDLPREIQNRINRFPLRVYWFDNVSIADKILIFTRINSGKPVTATDIARIKVKSRKAFVTLAEHLAISTVLKEQNIMRCMDEDIVQDIWLLSNIPNPSLSTKNRGLVLEATEATDEQTDEIRRAFDYLLSFYKSIEDDKKRFNKLRAKTHITSLGYMGVLAVRNNLSQENFIERAAAFVNTNGAEATVSDRYNKASSIGVTQTEQVKTRMDEIKKYIGI